MLVNDSNSNDLYFSLRHRQPYIPKQLLVI